MGSDQLRIGAEKARGRARAGTADRSLFDRAVLYPNGVEGRRNPLRRNQRWSFDKILRQAPISPVTLNRPPRRVRTHSESALEKDRTCDYQVAAELRQICSGCRGKRIRGGGQHEAGSSSGPQARQ